jgi:hypothetical protein
VEDAETPLPVDELSPIVSGVEDASPPAAVEEADAAAANWSFTFCIAKACVVISFT